MKARSFAPLVLSVFVNSSLSMAAPDPRELGWSRAWLRLLQYKDDARGSESLSTGGDFFASVDGRRDPVGEMEALRVAFSDPTSVEKKSGEPWACVFPARFLWLRQALNEKWVMPACREFDEFRAGFPADEVSIVFSTAYKGNPASIFGHSFLVFNARADLDHNRRGALLGYAVAFLADTEGEDNPVFYTLRGLSGGFQGKFDVKTYYETVNGYNNSENRDLWEYGLRLTADERQLLVAHLWEVSKRGFFHYYFLDENCSWHILSLIEAVRPDLDLKQLSPYVTIPSETIRDMRQAELLEGEPRLRPSLRRKLDWTLAALSPAERDTAAALLDGQRPAVNPRPEVWDAAVGEGQWRLLRQGSSPDASAREHYQRLLADRSKQPIGQLNDFSAESSDVSNRPDLGHALHHFSLGFIVIQGPKGGEVSPVIGGGLGFSDLLASDKGFEPDSGIKYGTFTLRQRRSTQAFVLSKGDLVSIESYSPWRPRDPKYSWGLGLSGRENLAMSATEYFGRAAGGITFRQAAFDVRLTAVAEIVAVAGLGAEGRRVEIGPAVALAKTIGPFKSIATAATQKNILRDAQVNGGDRMTAEMGYAASDQTEWRAALCYEGARLKNHETKKFKSMELSGRWYF